MSFDKTIFKTKSFWAGVGSIASGIGVIYAGSVPEGIQLIVAGITAIFLRDAIAKK